ncbi:TniQ family protein [Variovorax sp. J22R115]|uniref:TniQ family protein n=1 Tax=Variovorax sp. J22R115 TaxID=3053509 RepID=UPI002A2B2ED2|nr:TniQ family protein [Variovorax sp. J22R115]
MIPAPRLYPDELVSSGLTRCCRWFNLPFKRFAREELRVPGLRLNFVNLWPLRPLEELFNLSAEELLWKHTAFPYATAFVLGESFEHARSASLDGGPGMPRLLAAMQNVSAEVPHRRYCPQCVQESVARYGESYWHRAHNLPGALVCPWHACALVTTQLPASSTLRTIYGLPIECGQPIAPDAKPQPPRAILALARASRELLSRPVGPGHARDSEWYRHLAISKGWLSPPREVNFAALQGALLRTYPPAVLNSSGKQADRPNWASLFFRPATSFSFAPLKHLLVETLLSTRKPTRPMLDHVPTGPRGTLSEAVDAFYAPRAQKELRRALQQGDVLSTEQFLRRVGAFGPYRHRADQLPSLRQVVRDFRGSPASIKQLLPGKTLYRNTAGSFTDRDQGQREAARVSP